MGTDDIYRLVGLLRGYGKLEGALEILKSDERFNRCTERYNRVAGSLLLDLGRTSEAHVALDLALEIDPNSHGTFYEKGRACEADGDHDSAMRFYYHALHLKEDFAEAHINLAALLCDYVGDLDRALASVDRGLALNPGNSIGWANRGTILSKIGRLQEALDSFDKALRIEPHFVHAWLTKGGLFVDRLDMPDEGLRCFNRAIELAPDTPEVWWHLSIAMWVKKNPEEALKNIERYLYLVPDNPEAVLRRSQMLLLLGRNSDARQSCSKLQEIAPGDPKTERLINQIPPFDSAPVPGDIVAILLDLTKREEIVRTSMARIAQKKDNEEAAKLLSKMGANICAMGLDEVLSGYGMVFGTDSAIGVASSWLAENNGADIILDEAKRQTESCR